MRTWKARLHWNVVGTYQPLVATAITTQFRRSNQDLSRTLMYTGNVINKQLTWNNYGGTYTVVT